MSPYIGHIAMLKVKIENVKILCTRVLRAHTTRLKFNFCMQALIFLKGEKTKILGESSKQARKRKHLCRPRTTRGSRLQSKKVRHTSGHCQAMDPVFAGSKIHLVLPFLLLSPVFTNCHLQ